jgi:OmpR family response regulator RpaB
MTASAPAKETILVVDDEASIRRILETRLSMIGYQVITACDGVEALDAFRRTSPDLVVLDVMMPKLDGYGVCQELRKESDVPIVMLTALGDVADRITGLELGADDYVVEPFSPKELEARIRCVLRRVDKDQAAGIPNSGVIQVSDLKIDTNKRQVYRGDERIRLTGMEFSLLELLVGRSGEPFSRGEILKEVWGYTPERHVDTRVVDVHISRLRSKLEDDPANPELILTARGTGYLFQRIIEALAQKDTDISGRSPKRRRPQAIRRLVIWYRRNAAVTSLVDTASAASSVAGSMAGSVAGSVVSTAGSVAGRPAPWPALWRARLARRVRWPVPWPTPCSSPWCLIPCGGAAGDHPGSDQPIVDSERLWVAVDGMGGDYAPGPILEGCLRAVALLPVRVRFVAETAAVDQAVAALGLGEELAAAIDAGLIDVVASGPSVGMNEEATVVRRKRDASINMAMDLVKAGEAHRRCIRPATPAP